MNRLVLMLLACFSTQLSWANGMVDYLNVEEGKVYFSAGEKTQSSPACVAPASAEKWAVSLNSDAGRAIYSIVITAMSSRLPVTVTSAQDCADADSIERPLSVSITSDPSTSSNSLKQLYLYKGDGVTKLGRVINTESTMIFDYLDENENTFLKRYQRAQSNVSIYFTEQNCQGTPAITSPADFVFTHPVFNVGRFTKSSSNGESPLIKKVSFLKYDGICTNIATPDNAYVYVLDVNYEHPLCGNQVCVLKDE